MSLNGKHVFVTAAAQGIGYASAMALLKDGARITAVDINREALDRAYLQHPNVQKIVLDMTDAESVSREMGNILPIDILVNCVGWVDTGSILECDFESLDKSVKVNIYSAFTASRIAIRNALAEQRALNIINISSVISSISSAPNRFAYATTKAALIGMTKSIALDFIRSGIRCNAICPGTISSPSLLQRMAATATEEHDITQARLTFDERQPIGRMGTPEEVAGMVHYLACDISGFVSGSVFTIDGGWSI